MEINSSKGGFRCGRALLTETKVEREDVAKQRCNLTVGNNGLPVSGPAFGPAAAVRWVSARVAGPAPAGMLVSAVAGARAAGWGLRVEGFGFRV